MAGFLIRGFRGMRPILDPKLLEANEAQEAIDVRLHSGDIEPVRDNETAVALKSATPADVNTIFRVRNNADENLNWFEFDEEVDVALSPITQDAYGRVYWTGQNVPRYSVETQAFAAGSAPYPRNSFSLGIPKPTTQPNAVGTSVGDADTQEREYVITYCDSNASVESPASAITTVKALENDVDQGTLVSPTFSGGTSTEYTISVTQPHELIEEDFIAISGATDNGWNTEWEVSDVVNELTFKIKNTQTFPNAAPSGSYVIKQRYRAHVRLFALPDNNGGNLDITHKRIWRKINNIYRLVVQLPLEATEYEDFYVDAELSSATQLPTSIRPSRPAISPVAYIPFNDTSIEDATTLDANGNPVYPSLDNRVYAIAFVSAAGDEGTLSKASGIVGVIDGVTKVRVSHVEQVDDGYIKKRVVKKRIYRQDVTYLNGTFTIDETAYRLVAEIPVSQDMYEDLATAASIASNATPAVPNGMDEPNTAFGASAKLPPKVTPESRVYVYTYVSDYGEEGPPSEPSVLVDIDPGEPVNVSMGTAPTGYTNITKKYLYRSSPGTGATDYQFVAEVPVATPDYDDYIKQSELGETLPSTDWEPPPSDMKGLRVMANGIFVGFSDKDVCFSEPFMPHAWASKNFLPVDTKIVGLGAFGQSVAVLTQSYPYIATGIDPQAMTLIKTSLQQACVSKRSIVEAGDSVLYASPDGLVQIGLGGVQVLTSKILSQEQWQEYNPSSIHAYLHEGRYYGFYTKTDGSKGLMVFTLNGADAIFTLGTETTTAGHVVPTADSLYIVDGSNIVKMDKDAVKKSYKWSSKLFENPTPLNFSTAQVISQDYSPGVTLKVYADGSLVHTQTVTDSKPFRLPAGFIARDWYVTVEGKAKVSFVGLTQSVTELKQV
jgi:hypothetical protein